MIVFVDTEFTDFINTFLISLGAVTEDGREFYVEVTDYNKKASSEFTRHVVEPQLDHAKYGKTFVKASASFGSWLEELGEDVKICCDYQGDWDIIVDLLDNDVPQNVRFMHLHNQLNKDSLEKAIQLGTPDVSWFFGQCKKAFNEEVSAYFQRHKLRSHHALNDAKANKAGWEAAYKWMNQHY